MSKALSSNFRIQDTLEAAKHIEGSIIASFITGQPINTRASTTQPSELLNPDSDNTKRCEDAESQFFLSSPSSGLQNVGWSPVTDLTRVIT